MGWVRLSGIDRAGQLLLMELEITEPYLFLDTCPEAPRRFADAILQTLSG